MSKKLTPEKIEDAIIEHERVLLILIEEYNKHVGKIVFDMNKIDGKEVVFASEGAYPSTNKDVANELIDKAEELKELARELIEDE